MLEFNQSECERVIEQLVGEFGEFDRTHIGEHKLRQEGRRRPTQKLMSALRSFRSKK